MSFRPLSASVSITTILGRTSIFPFAITIYLSLCSKLSILSLPFSSRHPDLILGGNITAIGSPESHVATENEPDIFSDSPQGQYVLV